MRQTALRGCSRRFRQRPETWTARAQLALQKGDENLAREALTRKKSFSDAATSLKQQLDGQSGQVDTLKRGLMGLESKISEAKTKKEMLKARSAAAKANEQLQSAVNSNSTGSALAAFERMEDKVLMQEARSQAAGEIAGSNLEAQFAALSSSDVDDELAAMKLSLSPAANKAAIAPGATSTPSSTEMDAELEALKKQMDNLG